MKTETTQPQQPHVEEKLQTNKTQDNQFCTLSIQAELQRLGLN